VKKTKRPALPFMEQRRREQLEAKLAADAKSATRQAGSMTRGERDALHRTRTRVVTHKWYDAEPFTDPVKRQAKALRVMAKAARRQQTRGR
jgi:hypothetical protein